MKNRKLQKQLIGEGASQDDAAKLAELAVGLKRLRPRGLSADARQRMCDEMPVNVKSRHIVRWSLAGSFAVLAALVVFAQSALPGTALYQVKRGSEEARAWVQPGYEEKIVDERKQEVEQLQQKKVNPKVIQEAEDRYEKTYERVRGSKPSSSDDDWRNFDWDQWREDYKSEVKSRTDTRHRTDWDSNDTRSDYWDSDRR